MIPRIAAWAVVLGICYGVYVLGTTPTPSGFAGLAAGINPVAASLPKLPPGCTEKGCE